MSDDCDRRTYLKKRHIGGANGANTMASGIVSDDIIVIKIDNGYIRSHINEIRSLSITGERYCRLHGDGRVIYDRTNVTIDPNEKSLKDMVLELYVFNTNLFKKENVRFEAETNDLRKIRGHFTFSFQLKNSEIRRAEGVTFRNVSKGKSAFTAEDVSTLLSNDIVDNIKKHVRAISSEDISKDGSKVAIKGLPPSVKEWSEHYGFDVSIGEISVDYNEFDEVKKKQRDDQTEIEKQKKELEKLELKRRISICKAAIEIDETTGESKEVTEFKKLYSRSALYSNYKVDEFVKGGDYIIGVHSDRCILMVCDNSQDVIEFPNTVVNGDKEMAVTLIGPKIFKNPKAVKGITVAEGIIEIGNAAFQNCTGLTAISLPESLTTIGPNAFNNCIKLKKISIPDNVTSIDQDAFVGCPLSEIDVNEELDISDINLPTTTRRVRRQ